MKKKERRSNKKKSKSFLWDSLKSKKNVEIFSKNVKYKKKESLPSYYSFSIFPFQGENTKVALKKSP